MVKAWIKISIRFVIAIFGIGCLAFYSCEKWDLHEKDFIQVEITSIDSLDIDSVRISGQVLGLNTALFAGEKGILWTTQEAEPTYFYFEGKKPIGLINEKNDTFSIALKLRPGTAYSIRAYATVNEQEYYYSDNITYRTGIAGVTTLAINYTGGLSLSVSGALSETEKGFAALEHGFCYSFTNPAPSLNDQVINLGPRRNNTPFSAPISFSNDIDNIYIRSFAIVSYNFQRDTVFGKTKSLINLNAWIPKADFVGESRYHAVAFSIGQKGYFGFGYNYGNGHLNDFWEYDPATNNWSRLDTVNDRPSPRRDAVAFSIGQKGYLGFGFNYDNGYLNDFWEYDPASNNWSRLDTVNDHPSPRENAVAFSIGQKGYFGFGYNPDNEYLNDFWEYDPATNNWSRLDPFNDSPHPRQGAVAFSIGQKGYLGFGFNYDNGYLNDFWEYDPASNNWSRLDPVNDHPSPRTDAVAFSIGQKGYLGFGYNYGNGYLNGFWEYDPATNNWSVISFFKGKLFLSNAVGFSIGQKGYIIGPDFWEYDP